MPEPSAGETSFGELLDWIVEHLHEPLEVADMAARAANLRNRLHDAIGVTPTAYRQRFQRSA